MVNASLGYPLLELVFMNQVSSCGLLPVFEFPFGFEPAFLVNVSGEVFQWFWLRLL